MSPPVADRSPVHEDCAACGGYGRTPPTWQRCPICDGIGLVFVAGAPLFGCTMTLDKRKPGEIVTLGNGDRGRIIRHDKRGTPSTEIALIDDLFDVEDREPTRYPSSVGVRSVSSPAWFRVDVHDKTDALDPLQRGK